ncbi:alkylglycerol monooxygenase-like isoform X1 [Rhopilema esculentum]|uniref:alkylglycerol monooxygenase-like isoform X1 n=2 Tax=Rhopilema esculentum TaxID=499914 RepID=UPI0031D84889
MSEAFVQSCQYRPKMRFPNATASEQIRRIFYAVTPWESSYEKVDDVPDYLNEAVPVFIAAIAVEYLVAVLMGKRTLRFNDGASSLTAGLMSQLSKVMVLIAEFTLYVYVYENYRITALPWDSPWTWLLCFIVIDFTYYWFHRATHEVNFLWGAHQVHHSSEDYNLTTALRQSVVQNYTSWVFYFPLALVAPPSAFYVHHQLNTLYQFWIHTELIETLGPLEYILNTPSHHRVHHGRNPYCIDKNYAGTLIIWDRLFGTFQAEKEEKVVYGLVHPLESWNPIYIQFCHYKYMFETFWKMDGFRNKISFLVKGPGWVPGSPRLGNPEDIPAIEYPVVKFDKKLPLIKNVYVVIHSVVLSVAFQELAVKKLVLSVAHIWLVGGFIILTMTSLGFMFEHRSFAAPLETLRCLLFIVIDLVTSSKKYDLAVFPGNSLEITRIVYVISAFIWTIVTLKEQNETKEKTH